MSQEIPYWICKDCGRPLDDHQLRASDGRWLATPLCVKRGDIKDGLRFGGGK